MLTRSVIIFLHDFDHLIALLIHFYKSKANAALCKLAHLILNFVAFRTTFWIVVHSITNITSMPWGISNMECHFNTIVGPGEFKSFIKATLHIFGEVSASSCLLLLDILLHKLYIISKVSHIKAEGFVHKISVRYK